MGKYDRSRLIEFCKKESVTLDEIPEHSNRETRVSGQCKTPGCDGCFEKKVRYLFDKNGPYCQRCTDHRARIKDDGQYGRLKLLEFCKNEGITLDEIPEHSNRETRVSGQCKTPGCDGCFEKNLGRLIDATGPYCQRCTDHRAYIKDDGQYGRLKLLEFCKKEGITLDEIPEHSNRETRVSGQCKTEGCDGCFEKDLRQLIDISGPYCKRCTDHKARTNDDGQYGRLKLLEFCKKEGITLDEIPEHSNRETTVSGPCKTEGCDGCFEKKVRYLFDKTGPYCKRCTDHRSLTNDDGQYGRLKLLEFCKNEGITLDKLPEHVNRETKVSGPCKTEGCDGCFEKKVRYLFDKTGPCCDKCVDVNAQNKRINTCMERYDGTSPMHSGDIVERAQKAAYKRKLYITPSDVKWYLQGYEPLVAPKIIEEYGEENITPDIKIVPRIPWLDEDGTKRYYFCDFYVDSLNLLIEVKSTWTAKLNAVKIQRTRKASNELGYDFRLIVLNKKGEWIEDATSEGQRQPCNTSSP